MACLWSLVMLVTQALPAWNVRLGSQRQEMGQRTAAPEDNQLSLRSVAYHVPAAIGTAWTPFHSHWTLCVPAAWDQACCGGEKAKMGWCGGRLLQLNLAMSRKMQGSDKESLAAWRWPEYQLPPAGGWNAHSQTVIFEETHSYRWIHDCAELEPGHVLVPEL